MQALLSISMEVRLCSTVTQIFTASTVSIIECLLGPNIEINWTKPLFSSLALICFKKEKSRCNLFLYFTKKKLRAGSQA